MRASLIYAIVFGVQLSLGSANAQDSTGLTDEEFDALEQTAAYREMRPPQKLNFSEEDVADIVEKAKAAWDELTIDEADPSKHYQVVLQVGHYPRTKGATGSQGKLINEQQASALVATYLSDKLSELEVEHIIIGADSYKEGKKRDDGTHYFKTDIFISLHMDGSDRPCRVGPSLGYNPRFGKEAMQTLGVAVAIALRLNARDFMRDNYTSIDGKPGSLSHFYTYKHSDTQIAEGIVEMSELSCPPDELKFLGSAEQLAENLATGITFMLGERR